MNFIKFVRIFLLILIVIGVGLLLTQKYWVPKVVDMILGAQPVLEQQDYAKVETPVATPDSTTTPEEGTATVTATKTNYKTFKSGWRYSFQYPENYTLESHDEGGYEYLSKDNDVRSTIHVRIRRWSDYYLDNTTLTRASTEVFLKHNNEYLRSRCDADGEGPSSVAKDIVKQTKFTNKNNITFYETYFKYYERGDEYAGIVGPFYSMNFFPWNAILTISSFDVCDPKPSIEPPQQIEQDIIKSFNIEDWDLNLRAYNSEVKS